MSPEFRAPALHSLHLQPWRLLLSICSVFAIGLAASGATCCAGGLVRVSDGKNNYEGKVVALSGSQCSLIDRMGQLVRLNVRQLKTFEKISSQYQPESPNAFRDALRREFPGDYEVTGTSHYLVCGPRGKAERFGALFESIYREVEQFYRVHGFEIHPPEVPLVAVVFRSQKEFMRYCVQDGVPPSPGLMGYYSLKTNRVAMFDDESLRTEVTPEGAPDHFPALLRKDRSIVASTGISGMTASTVVHETIHQVGYNIGIHSRAGGAPLWVVEGLATVLEPDGIRHRRGRQLLADRLNQERHQWFTQQHRPDRSDGNLAGLIASDRFFHQNTLDSYSESWAFCFFLLENSTRCRDFVKYLHRISDRDKSEVYSAKQRLQDFQDVFGDLRRVEIEFLRFMDRL